MLASILTITLIIGGTALLSWPLGKYMAALFSGRFARADRLFTTFTGDAGEQDWKSYALALAAFNVVMFVFVFALLATQHLLPLNPDGQGAASLDLVFNTAARFTTNTNLQHYSGREHLELPCPAWRADVAAVRVGGDRDRGAGGAGARDRRAGQHGQLLPRRAAGDLPGPAAAGDRRGRHCSRLSGVPMTLEGAATVTTLEGAAQTIARGPVAAFVAIKQLGTNGGGFFGPNSTHPFENPSFWANAHRLASIIIIPMACVWMFGRIIDRTQPCDGAVWRDAGAAAIKIDRRRYLRKRPHQAFADLPVQQDVGNLEGKELRLGAITGPFWAVLTTATSNGSVGAMHDSLNPLTGLVPMVGMWLNATFGGVGVGMINMFLYIALAVFVAGMMVGRTPEYLGHRIEGREMRLAVLALFCHPLLILGGTALFAATAWGLDTLNNTGAHGFSEILYEFSSAAANNGSGFEGLGDNTVAVEHRHRPRHADRALPADHRAAGDRRLADGQAPQRRKRRHAERRGGGTFGVMLLITILIFGALTFFPAAALGPIAEHVTLMAAAKEHLAMNYILPSIRLWLVTFFVCVVRLYRADPRLCQDRHAPTAPTARSSRSMAGRSAANLSRRSSPAPRYFWPRPSAADYNGMGAAGSNLSPTSRKLAERARRRPIAALWRDRRPTRSRPTLSRHRAAGSIRISRLPARCIRWTASPTARGLTPAACSSSSRGRRPAPGGALAPEPIVNVLELNLALDRLER